MTLNFCPSKFCWKITFKQGRFFDHQNYVEKSKWKQHRFFDQRNDTEKSLWKQCGFFDHRNYVKKKHMETTWIFPSAKLHWPSTWKWRGNFSKLGRWRIDVISTSNQRRFDVVCLLGYLSIHFGPFLQPNSFLLHLFFFNINSWLMFS